MRSAIAVAAALLLAGAASSRGQGMTREQWLVSDIQVGYSYLHDDNVGIGPISGSFPLGWQLSGTYNVIPAVGAVVDVSGHYKTDDVVPGSNAGDLKLRIYGFHGGVRFTGRGEYRPYLQVLAGATRSSVDVAGVGSSTTSFSLQSGAGVMVPVTETLGISLGADYRLVFTDVSKTNEIRAYAGVVLHLTE